VFLLITPHPPKSTLFPYTTLFRSEPGNQLDPVQHSVVRRILKVPPSGGWKAARTRTLECVRYVAQLFQAAGWRSFPAPQRTPACGGTWWYLEDAPAGWGRRTKIFVSFVSLV